MGEVTENIGAEKKSCWDKQYYKSKKRVKNSLRHNPLGKAMTYYKCEYCDGWHKTKKRSLKAYKERTKLLCQ